MIEYHSPKQYQKGWMGESNSNPAKLPKPKSKYCKKLKGEHKYGEWHERVPVCLCANPLERHSGFWERFCVGCNRKETWIAPNLPGPYWKLDLNAKPPGYGREPKSEESALKPDAL